MIVIFPLLAFIGVLMVIISVILAIRRYFFLQSALTAQGVITHVETRSSTRTHQNGTSSKTLFRPTARFQTQSGHTVEHADKIATSKRWEVGQPVIVNYDATDPSSFVLGDRSGLGVYLPAIIVAGVGSGFVVMGVIMTFLFASSGR